MEEDEGREGNEEQVVAITKEPRADDPMVATTIIGNKAGEVV